MDEIKSHHLVAREQPRGLAPAVADAAMTSSAADSPAPKQTHRGQGPGDAAPPIAASILGAIAAASEGPREFEIACRIFSEDASSYVRVTALRRDDWSTQSHAPCSTRGHTGSVRPRPLGQLMPWSGIASRGIRAPLMARRPVRGCRRNTATIQSCNVPESLRYGRRFNLFSAAGRKPQTRKREDRNHEHGNFTESNPLRAFRRTVAPSLTRHRPRSRRSRRNGQAEVGKQAQNLAWLRQVGSLSREKIARRGGKAAHSGGTAHEFTSEEARIAGRKGGQATHARRGKKFEGPGRALLPRAAKQRSA